MQRLLVIAERVHGVFSLACTCCSNGPRPAKERRKMRHVNDIILIFTFAIFGCQSSPEDSFEEAVAKPIPESVRLINTKKTTFPEIAYWLHFSIEPDDMDSILQSLPFIEDERFSLDFRAFSPPGWWDPSKLGRGTKCYQYEHERELSGSLEYRIIFIVNKTNSECYYLKYIY